MLASAFSPYALLLPSPFVLLPSPFALFSLISLLSLSSLSSPLSSTGLPKKKSESLRSDNLRKNPFEKNESLLGGTRGIWIENPLGGTLGIRIESLLDGTLGIRTEILLDGTLEMRIPPRND